MRPCQINTGILQMIDKVKSNNDLKYEQLEYYKRRIIQEKNRLNDYIYMSPNVVQDQIQNELISQLDTALEIISDLISKLQTVQRGVSFSDLTKRLKEIK